MGLRRSNDQRRAVVFGVGVLGSIIASTSLAFACTPIVGLMTMRNVHPTSSGFNSESVTVGMGRARSVGPTAMDFCEDNLLTATPNDGVVGGATAAQGEVITIEVAPMACQGPSLEQVTNYAQVIQDEYDDEFPPDPREWEDGLDLELANFLLPGLAYVNYRTDTFDIDTTTDPDTYTYAGAASDCMYWQDSYNAGFKVGGVNTGLPLGSMVITAGVGTATLPVPNGSAAFNGVTWPDSPAGSSGGVCVYSEIPVGTGMAAAISMAPLTVI